MIIPLISDPTKVLNAAKEAANKIASTIATQVSNLTKKDSPTTPQNISNIGYTRMPTSSNISIGYTPAPNRENPPVTSINNVATNIPSTPSPPVTNTRVVTNISPTPTPPVTNTVTAPPITNTRPDTVNIPDRTTSISSVTNISSTPSPSIINTSTKPTTDYMDLNKLDQEISKRVWDEYFRQQRELDEWYKSSMRQLEEQEKEIHRLYDTYKKSIENYYRGFKEELRRAYIDYLYRERYDPITATKRIHQIWALDKEIIKDLEKLENWRASALSEIQKAREQIQAQYRLGRESINQWLNSTTRSLRAQYEPLFKAQELNKELTDLYKKYQEGLISDAEFIKEVKSIINKANKYGLDTSELDKSIGLYEYVSKVNQSISYYLDLFSKGQISYPELQRTLIAYEREFIQKGLDPSPITNLRTQIYLLHHAVDYDPNTYTVTLYDPSLNILTKVSLNRDYRFLPQEIRNYLHEQLQRKIQQIQPYLPKDAKITGIDEYGVIKYEIPQTLNPYELIGGYTSKSSTKDNLQQLYTPIPQDMLLSIKSGNITYSNNQDRFLNFINAADKVLSSYYNLFVNLPIPSPFYGFHSFDPITKQFKQGAAEGIKDLIISIPTLGYLGYKTTIDPNFRGQIRESLRNATLSDAFSMIVSPIKEAFEVSPAYGAGYLASYFIPIPIKAPKISANIKTIKINIPESTILNLAIKDPNIMKSINTRISVIQNLEKEIESLNKFKLPTIFGELGTDIKLTPKNYLELSKITTQELVKPTTRELLAITSNIINPKLLDLAIIGPPIIKRYKIPEFLSELSPILGPKLHLELQLNNVKKIFAATPMRFVYHNKELTFSYKPYSIISFALKPEHGLFKDKYIIFTRSLEDFYKTKATVDSLTIPLKNKIYVHYLNVVERNKNAQIKNIIPGKAYTIILEKKRNVSKAITYIRLKNGRELLSFDIIKGKNAYSVAVSTRVTPEGLQKFAEIVSKYISPRNRSKLDFYTREIKRIRSKPITTLDKDLKNPQMQKLISRSSTREAPIISQDIASKVQSTIIDKYKRDLIMQLPLPYQSQKRRYQMLLPRTRVIHSQIFKPELIIIPRTIDKKSLLKARQLQLILPKERQLILYRVKPRLLQLQNTETKVATKPKIMLKTKQNLRLEYPKPKLRTPHVIIPRFYFVPLYIKPRSRSYAYYKKPYSKYSDKYKLSRAVLRTRFYKYRRY